MKQVNPSVHQSIHYLQFKREESLEEKAEEEEHSVKLWRNKYPHEQKLINVNTEEEIPSQNQRASSQFFLLQIKTLSEKEEYGKKLIKDRYK